MYRDASLTGEARQMALMFLAIGIGGFIVYLTVTRR
jgi:preprotein translocase subunit Sss1